MYFVLPKKIWWRNSHVGSRSDPKRDVGSVQSRQNHFTQTGLGNVIRVCSNLLQIALKWSHMKANIKRFTLMALKKA